MDAEGLRLAKGAGFAHSKDGKDEGQQAGWTGRTELKTGRAMYAASRAVWSQPAVREKTNVQGFALAQHSCHQGQSSVGGRGGLRKAAFPPGGKPLDRLRAFG